MPSFPDGLEIDHSKSLNGTMAPYAEQLLVCTGQRDWPSKVEDDHGGENLVADLKELIGRGGKFADVSSCFLSRFTFVFQVLAGSFYALRYFIEVHGF